MRLGDLGEKALIGRIAGRFRKSTAILGIGDDAAVLALPPNHSLVFCSDLMVEDTHFRRSLHPPDSVGYKAVAVNVSDVGAMGGTPMCFVVSLAAPPDLEVEWVENFYSGIERACAEFNIELVGGDSSSAAIIFTDVAMMGRVPSGKHVSRSGAQPGDVIYVTGELGGSTMGLQSLQSGTAAGFGTETVKRHLYPQPRHRVGAAVADRAHAMIDVSDGLSTDLGHILDASGVSARIHMDRLPRFEGADDASALHGGEEYELLIVASNLPGIVEGIPLTPIGEIIPSNGEHQALLNDRGTETPLLPRGWQHF